MGEKNIQRISEQEMLDKLGIPDWRHMSKDKIIEFASSMPYLDPEVAKKALEQFPKFSQLGTDIVNSMRESLERICESDAKISQKTQESIMESIHILEKQLDRWFISSAERDRIIDGILELNKNLVDLENGRRHFWKENFQAAVLLACSVMGLGATILGATIKKN